VTRVKNKKNLKNIKIVPPGATLPTSGR